MELIERVQASVVAAMYGEPFDAHQMPEAYAFAEKVAKAAIRAMLDGVEPYAWHCVSKKYPDLDSLVMDAANSPSPEFNETPLYSLDALKDAI